MVISLNMVSLRPHYLVPKGLIKAWRRLTEDGRTAVGSRWTGRRHPSLATKMRCMATVNSRKVS